MQDDLLDEIEISKPDYPILMMVASHGRILSVGITLGVVVILLSVYEEPDTAAIAVSLFAGGTVFCLGLFLQDIARLLVDTLVPK